MSKKSLPIPKSSLPTSPKELQELRDYSEMLMKKLLAETNGSRPTEAEPDSDEYKVTFPALKKAHTVRRRITVPWGSDLTSIEVDQWDWKQICEGEEVDLTITDMYEGEEFTMHWAFNTSRVRANGIEDNLLIVSYGDDGGEAFVGTLAGADIKIIA